MKTNKKMIKSSLIALALTATTATVVFAASPSDDELLRHAKMREVVKTVVRNLMDFRKETPLSEEQKDQIRDILQNHHAEIRKHAEAGKSAREAFRAASIDSPDSEETVAAAEAIGKSAKDRALLGAKIRAEVRPILTPKQLESIESAWKEVGSKVDAAILSFN